MKHVILYHTGKERKSREAADDGGFQEHRVTSLGSTPDISSAMDDRSASGGRQRLTYSASVEHSNSFTNR